MAGLDVGNDGWRSLSRPSSRKLKYLKDHEGFLHFILLLSIQISVNPVLCQNKKSAFGNKFFNVPM